MINKSDDVPNDINDHLWSLCRSCGIITDKGAKTCPGVLYRGNNGVSHDLEEVVIHTPDLMRAMANGKFFAKAHSRDQIQEILSISERIKRPPD